MLTKGIRARRVTLTFLYRSLQGFGLYGPMGTSCLKTQGGGVTESSSHFQSMVCKEICKKAFAINSKMGANVCLCVFVHKYKPYGKYLRFAS